MKQPASITGGNGKNSVLPVWPEQQSIGRWDGTDIVVTQFCDHADYAPALLNTVLQRAGDKNLSHHFADDNVLNAVKVYDLEKWNTPESDLIGARALEMFGRVIKKTDVAIDASWASVYKSGNFVMPHSHPGSIASVLYMLEPGDNTEVAGGQFLFADPRLKPCCRQQNGFMTTPSAPGIVAGTMVMFPGKAVHMVTPYLGSTPRITLSWDLKLAGSTKTAVPSSMTRPD